MSPEFTSTIVTCLWLICTSLAIIGSIYAGFAAFLLRQSLAKPPAAAFIRGPRLTVLKPLCGAEPELELNLASFCTQDYPGQVQIILGIQEFGRSGGSGGKTPHLGVSASCHRASDERATAGRQSQDIKRHQRYVAQPRRDYRALRQRHSCRPDLSAASGRRPPEPWRRSRHLPLSRSAGRRILVTARRGRNRSSFPSQRPRRTKAWARQALFRLDHCPARRDAAPNWRF